MHPLTFADAVRRVLLCTRLGHHVCHPRFLGDARHLVLTKKLVKTKKYVNYMPLPGCPGIQDRALPRHGASLQRSTTKDRNPVARMIGV
jgi:hypothetical protein